MLKVIKEKIIGFSQYAEKYTKVGHSDFLGSGFWVSLSQTVSIGLGILTSIMFARYSDKITFGYYQFAFAVFGTMIPLSLPGISTAVVRSLVLGKNGSLFYGFKAKLKFSLWGALALFLVAGYFYFIKHDVLITKVFVLLGCFFPINYPFTIFFSYFTAHKLYKQMAIWQSVARIFTAVGVMVGILFFNNIFLILLVYCSTTMFFNIIMCVYFYKKKEGSSGEIDTSVVTYGKQLTISNILPQVLNNFDRVVLPMFLGVEALAIYVVAVKIPDTIKGFFTSFIDSAFLPKLVAKKSDLVIEKIKNIWFFSSFIILLAVIILVLPVGIRLLFGSTYEAAILPAQIYTLAILPFFLRRIANNWMQANGKSKLFFINQTVFILATCTMMVIFLFAYKDIISMVLAKNLAVAIAAANGFYLMHKERKNNL